MKKVLIIAMMIALCNLGTSFAEEGSEKEKSGPMVSFSGYADADFAGGFIDTSGGSTGFSNPLFITGLEVDLTTKITFNDKVNVVLYTTMNDGVVPAMGAGTWWPGVNFDGLTLNWTKNEDMTIMVGDLITGVGYFGYYLNKRSAVVVGEHAFRGVGLQWKSLKLHTGLASVPGGGRTDSDWGLHADYNLALGEGMSITPAIKVVIGDSTKTPINTGVAFSGSFGENFGLNASVGINTDGAEVTDPKDSTKKVSTDLGFTLLIEPSYSMGNMSVAATFFMNSKGDTMPTWGSNIPKSTLSPFGITNAPFEDMFFYIEPGYSVNDAFAVGLPIEYHDPSSNTEKDESLWLVPTLYFYPADGVEWWLWGQMVKPMADDVSTTSADESAPMFFFGSEVIVSF